ncbi:MAG: N-acetyltransferase [Chloroflexi bacterium]|nr:N-acetyltransferase [Chloroflexota bacterium]
MIEVHSSADVSPDATVGEGTRIWHQAQVCSGARVGPGCTLGKGVYIDSNVSIGAHVKLQNGVSVYHGVTLEDGVFCGPNAVFTNDRLPRAINPDGSSRAAEDWELTPTLVQRGASIGANATIVCGVTIGRWAMIGAGSVVIHDVPEYGLVVGNPARLIGFVCACGGRLEGPPLLSDPVVALCPGCSSAVEIPLQIWSQAQRREPVDG